MKTMSYVSPGILVSQAQATGYHHRKHQQPCEDSIYIKSSRHYIFCGLADGQSGADYGKEGGRACLEAIADHIETVEIEKLTHFPFPDELPCAMVKVYRKRLLALSKQKHTHFRNFASTLLAIALDLRTGNYILLHLGDGCAVSIPHDGEPSFISSPDNGLTSCHTWLTTSDNAVFHFRIVFGSLNNKKRILLMSDGASCFCLGNRMRHNAKDLLKSGTSAQLQKHLIRSDPTDDASCIILDLYPPDSTVFPPQQFLHYAGSE